MNHELWYLVAWGLLDGIVQTMQAVTDIHARRLLWGYHAFEGQVYQDAYRDITPKYVPNPQAVGGLLACIRDPEYDPIIDPATNRPVNAASDGTTLTCDAPPAECTAYVFELVGKRFFEVGTLAENSTPDSGVYVIALRVDGSENLGLPSDLLTIT